MKIVYCIAGTRHSGGMERVLANKVNWLVAKGHEIHVVTTDQNGEPPFFKIDERIKCHDLEIGYEDNNGKSLFNKIINYPFKQILHRIKLKKLLFDLKPDIVVSMFCNDVSILPSVKDGSVKILEVHFSRFKRLQYGRKGIWRFIDKFLSKQDKRIAKKYDKFVVLTEEDRKLWGNDMYNIKVIPNAHSFRLDIPASCDANNVLAVGRFTYQKGFDRLIEAWGVIAPSFPEWKLTIVGGGELFNDYKTQIKSIGIEDNVILKEATSDIKSEYLNSSVYVMSSHYEGLPMALLEAQASGLPIVSFACKCGPRDIVSDGVDGFLVDEGDIGSLAEKLMVLMKDKSLRKKFGKNAYHKSLEYTNEMIMQRWVELFCDLKNNVS